jgi:hypothetical protein
MVPAEYRFLSPDFTIDPGFVHHRSLESMFGPGIMRSVDMAIQALPSSIPEWLKPTRIDHIYTRYALELCRQLKIPTMEALIRNEGLRRGLLFCSTDAYKGCPDFYEVARGRVQWRSDIEGLPDVFLEFSTSLVRADTLKSRLHHETTLSAIGMLSSVEPTLLVFDPLVMGFPWLSSSGTNNAKVDERLMWFGHSFYEHYIEDIDEFAKVKEVPLPESPDEMQYVSEASFKKYLAKILGDTSSKDWGGERSDYFSAHIHLAGRRTTAAFLLKGPAHFRPMEMIHCGAKADQIYRLAQEPAELLVLQHCHDIGPAVRAHLRAFAVSPIHPRRYCVIDGQDSIRLLKAYNLFEQGQDRRRRTEQER